MTPDPAPQGRRYDTLWQRLMANSAESSDSEGACWVWTGSKRSRYGYGRINVYVPACGDSRCLTAHVLVWVMTQNEPLSTDELYLAYLEVRGSGLQIDHLCCNTECINPDHLELVTPRENSQRRHRL